ncbi:hypothetical protein NPIL_294371 [Nephila pilipes]|uniref:Uncharacterized protein n=1 Tax=Nephila pilipes TaxID=299642 RepID=A0A8X6QZ74_NEPPI|nr:hypothetical protein NPIL_294371 [Nephila pilipes]
MSTNDLRKEKIVASCQLNEELLMKQVPERSQSPLSISACSHVGLQLQQLQAACQRTIRENVYLGGNRHSLPQNRAEIRGVVVLFHLSTIILIYDFLSQFGGISSEIIAVFFLSVPIFSGISAGWKL